MLDAAVGRRHRSGGDVALELLLRGGQRHGEQVHLRREALAAGGPRRGDPAREGDELVGAERRVQVVLDPALEVESVGVDGFARCGGCGGVGLNEWG